MSYSSSHNLDHKSNIFKLVFLRFSYNNLSQILHYGDKEKWSQNISVFLLKKKPSNVSSVKQKSTFFVHNPKEQKPLFTMPWFSWRQIKSEEIQTSLGAFG